MISYEKTTTKIAAPKDAPILTKISHAAKMHWNYPPEWMDLWKNDLVISAEYIRKHTVMKLVASDEIAGFCAIESAENSYEITHLWIHPKFIGNGFGTKLLNETIMAVVKPGATIYVVADPNAEAFYRRMAFETVGKTESLPKGRFLPVMQKIYRAPGNASA